MALRKESSRQAGRAAHRRKRPHERDTGVWLTCSPVWQSWQWRSRSCPQRRPPRRQVTTLQSRVCATAVARFLVRGERVIPVRRFVPHTVAVAQAAVSSLLRGPTAAERKSGCSSLIPAGTGLRGVSVSRGVAAVDLSRRFESGGGSLSMQLRVAQVVFTLTQFPAVSRVAFRLDGRPVESIGGEGILGLTAGRPRRLRGADSADPRRAAARRATLSARSILVRGTANVFEARLVVDLVTTNGVLLARRNVLAAAGTGTRGRIQRTDVARRASRALRHRCLCALTEERRPNRPRAHSRNDHAADLTGPRSVRRSGSSLAEPHLARMLAQRGARKQRNGISPHLSIRD